MHDAIPPVTPETAPTADNYLAVPQQPALAKAETHANAAAVNLRQHQDIIATRRSIRKLLYRLAGAGAAVPALGDQPVTVSRVELAALIALSQGIGDDAAATTLELDNAEFHAHLDKICSRLHATSRAHAVAIAMRRGLLD